MKTIKIAVIEEVFINQVILPRAIDIVITYEKESTILYIQGEVHHNFSMDAYYDFHQIAGRIKFKLRNYLSQIRDSNDNVIFLEPCVRVEKVEDGVWRFYRVENVIEERCFNDVAVAIDALKYEMLSERGGK